MNLDFKGRVALVTGGTRGIGAAVASALARLGANVIITGTIMPLTDIVTDAQVQFVKVNFSDRTETREFLQYLKSLSRLDICINNAGINKLNLIEDVEITDFEEMVRVNIEAPLLITKTITPLMKRQRYGRVVNISSVFGRQSREKRSAYSITKFGINGLTVASAIELANFGILVNTVSPGFTLTDLTKKNLSQDDMDKLCARIPAGRLAETSEIASAVVFLASSYNTYICGQDLAVDGGFSCT